MDDLSPYDRTTVNLWRRSYRELTAGPDFGPLTGAAIHAVLANLRQDTEAAVLFRAYEAEAARDFALIQSLLPGTLSDERLWRVRDAAFHLRWVELRGDTS